MDHDFFNRERGFLFEKSETFAVADVHLKNSALTCNVRQTTHVKGTGQLAILYSARSCSATGLHFMQILADLMGVNV